PSSKQRDFRGGISRIRQHWVSSALCRPLMNWLLCGAFDPGYAAFLDRGQPEGCSGSALFSVQLLCTSEERQKIAVASSIHGDACSGFWSLDRIHPSAQTFEAGEEHMQLAVDSCDVGGQPR